MKRSAINYDPRFTGSASSSILAEHFAFLAAALTKNASSFGKLLETSLLIGLESSSIRPEGVALIAALLTFHDSNLSGTNPTGGPRGCDSSSIRDDGMAFREALLICHSRCSISTRFLGSERFSILSEQMAFFAREETSVISLLGR